MSKSKVEAPQDIISQFPEKHTDDTPVVLLLGWVGCQDKYLQKYSKMYEDKGLITIRYCGTQSVSHTFWDRIGLIDAAVKIRQYLYDKKLQSHPVMLHIFSNGGAFLYEHVSKKFREGSDPIDVKGIIFDSCPGERRVKTLFLVMQEIFGKTPVIGPVLGATVFATLFCLYIAQLFFYKVKEQFVGYTPGSDPYGALLRDDTKYPQLFIYSKKDHLIYDEDVDYFANHRKTLGNKVTKVCFEDSLHVKHYMAHPEVYQNTIQKFMEECLERVEGAR